MAEPDVKRDTIEKGKAAGAKGGETATLEFERGTLVRGAQRDNPPRGNFWVWREEIGRWHADAYRYRHAHKLEVAQDLVPAWTTVSLYPKLPTLRDYQTKAKEKWIAEKAGLIVLPTGTGKTAVGLAIMADLAVSTLVVCPTRDLMYQWATKIEESLGFRPGVIGDMRFEERDLCVTTYHSACIHMPRLGNKFGLIIFDECHHLPGRVRGDAARMAAAPYRLGLTATPPVEEQLATIHDLIGPVVYSMGVKEARGRTLAPYATIRIRVSLTPDEESSYRSASRVIQDFVVTKMKENPRFKWEDIHGELAGDAAARKALGAARQKRSIEDRASEKLDILEDLFRQHPGMPTIIFTGTNVAARAVSKRFLIPYILAETGRDERRAILKGFEEGTFPALVANEVLDEGIDLPAAKVAIILGGKTSSRQAVQRLGRILRRDGDIPATLYEIVCDDTKEEAQSRRRTDTHAYEGTRNLRL